MTPDQGAFGLQQFSVLNTIINQTCAAAPRCNPGSVYRSADGSCNNLNNPAWGMSRTALQRILAPAYENGIFTPRVASDGGALPSARDVSNLATGSANNPYPDLAISVMTWGQFLDHDLSISPIFRLGEIRDRETGTLSALCLQRGVAVGARELGGCDAGRGQW